MSFISTLAQILAQRDSVDTGEFKTPSALRTSTYNEDDLARELNNSINSCLRKVTSQKSTNGISVSLFGSISHKDSTGKKSYYDHNSAQSIIIINSISEIFNCLYSSIHSYDTDTIDIIQGIRSWIKYRVHRSNAERLYLSHVAKALDLFIQFEKEHQKLSVTINKSTNKMKDFSNSSSAGSFNLATLKLELNTARSTYFNEIKHAFTVIHGGRGESRQSLVQAANRKFKTSVDASFAKIPHQDLPENNPIFSYRERVKIGIAAVCTFGLALIPAGIVYLRRSGLFSEKRRQLNHVESLQKRTDKLATAGERIHMGIT